MLKGIDDQGEVFPKILLVILTIALAVRVWGTWFGHPFILHPDEAWIAQKALGFLKGPGWDPNPHFFEYPSLYMYVVAALYLVAGVFLKIFGLIGSLNELYHFAMNHIFYFHLLGRLATALLGTATIFVTFLTAQRLFGNMVALISAWLLSFAYLHVTDSHFLTTDVPSGFFVMMTVYFSTLALTGGRARHLYWGGFFGGLAASTKYPCGLVIFTVLVATMFLNRSTGQATLAAIFSRRAIKSLGLCLIGFFLGTPYALLDFRSFGSGLLHQLSHSRSGHLGVDESGFFGYFTSVVPSGGIGIILLIATLGGIIISLWRHQSRDWLLFSFPVLFYLLLGNSNLKVERYLIPAIPFFCIYAGIFIEKVARLITLNRFSGSLVTGFVVLLFSVQSIYYVGKWCWISVQSDTRIEAAVWFERTISEGTHIAYPVGSWMLPPINKSRYQVEKVTLLGEESEKQCLLLKLKLLQHPVAGWFMKTLLRYRTSESEIKTQILQFPDFSRWRAQPLSYYKEKNVQFFITSSLLEGRFYSKTMIQKFPEMTRSWQEFYQSLETEGKLIKEFIPPPSLSHPWGMGFLERPIIRVYSLGSALPDLNQSQEDSLCLSSEI